MCTTLACAGLAHLGLVRLGFAKGWEDFARACLVRSGPAWYGPRNGVGNEVRAASSIVYQFCSHFSKSLTSCAYTSQKLSWSGSVQSVRASPEAERCRLSGHGLFRLKPSLYQTHMVLYYFYTTLGLVCPSVAWLGRMDQDREGSARWT